MSAAEAGRRHDGGATSRIGGPGGTSGVDRVTGGLEVVGDEAPVRVDVSGDDRCSAVVDHINEFIDREVDVRDLEAVRAHLLRCPPCLAQHDVQVALRDLVRRSCAERAPAELRVRILTTITRVHLVD